MNDINNNTYRQTILTSFLKKQFNSNHNISRTTSKHKWTTLQHNGLKFPDEYIQKNIPLVYNGKEIILAKESEEIAFLYAKYINTEYVNNNTFNKNFFNDWKKILGKNNEIQSLQLCDFSKIKEYIDKKNEEKKIERKNKINTIDTDNKYKIAIVDGKPQAVSNYKVEQPGIFIGRGKNPHLGKIKKRIYPENITINIGKNEKIPDPPINHKWKKIIHDRNVEWMASWKDTVTGKTKYLWLAVHSDIKSNNDQKKYDLAKKLKKKIKRINEENDKNLKSNDIKIRQIATCLFFIDKLALRIGNEKSEDETDTVGVTSLRIEHIKLNDNNTITLNFLGKDSVPYTNTINVSDTIYKNIQDFIKNKSNDDQVFDKITSTDVNKYLQEFMQNLTAKVFRTYNASNLFQKELKKITHKYEYSDNQKAIFDAFVIANAKVAKMMNHQKNISTGYKKNLDKIANTLHMLKKKLTNARRSIKKNPKIIKKIKEKIKNIKSKKELVKEMKNISLGTSKANYIDPRITVAFMKKHKLDIDKIFSKTLKEKFKWAFEVDENYIF